jgi:hypothetical protein
MALACGEASSWCHGMGRRGKRLQVSTAPDSAPGCLIKGNVSPSGELIFHIPGGQNYDRTNTPALPYGSVGSGLDLRPDFLGAVFQD